MFEKVNCIDCAHLPCKVGDTAYFVSAGGIHNFTVGTVMAEVSEEGTITTSRTVSGLKWRKTDEICTYQRPSEVVRTHSKR